MRLFLIFSVLISVVVLSSSCSHMHSVGSSEIRFDSNLILSWSKAQKNLETAKSPALYEFEKAEKKLWYLASQHSNDVEAPAFKLIKWLPDVPYHLPAENPATNQH